MNAVRETAAVTAARRRAPRVGEGGRRSRISKVVQSVDDAGAGACEPSPPSKMSRVTAAVGCLTDEVALGLLTQVVRLQHPPASITTAEMDRLVALGTAQISELHPTSAHEGMLAAHMVGCHQLAMTFMARATEPTQTVDGAERNVTRAARLMRLFLEQTDAYERLKGRTLQQRVTVEHVTVQPGGQAIVGAVSPATAGRQTPPPARRRVGVGPQGI